MLHAAIGLVTESAELIDMIKKHIYYGKDFDEVNAKEEAGDIAWYLGLAINEMKTTMNDVLSLNIEKLKLRYPNKFSSEDAINRDVVAERELLEEKSKMVLLYDHSICEYTYNTVEFAQSDYKLQIVEGVPYHESAALVSGVFRGDTTEKKLLEEDKYPKTQQPCPIAPPVHQSVSCGNISYSPVIYKSQRAVDWIRFACEVANHIENYTVKQYGDRPNDQASDWSIEHCIEELKKYANRYGKNQREGQDALGFLKIAHYCQIAALKHKEVYGKDNTKCE
jgi:NTP pyrophosphatase (non-canonical NTP hydrolase)